MRFLTIGTQGEVHLVNCEGRSIPSRYAILSHRWGGDHNEVNYKDLMKGSGQNKVGYEKIIFCVEQATKDGLTHFWIDTCCIDKKNSTELQKAITSMFHWYAGATKCYVYLQDVSILDQNPDGCLLQYPWEWKFRNSDWFKRGWTLQELIAPTTVEFFSKEHEFLGTKKSLEGIISEITGIPVIVLQGGPLSDFSIDERMLWSEGRETSEPEDEAYSLLGIFDVSIVFMYGEGKDRAKSRLRREIAASESQQPRVKRGLEGHNRLAPSISGFAMTRFQGRAEICTSMEQKLLREPSEHSTNLFLLHGLSGLGKTTIAQRYWTKHRNSYYLIWHIDGSDERSVCMSFGDLAANISDGDDTGHIAPIQQTEDPSLLAKLTKEWLEKQRYHWLLILDSAENQKVQYEDYLPISRFGSIIITTQKPRIFSFVPKSHSCEVTSLDAGPSIALLSTMINRNATEDPLLRARLLNIVEALGYHPLGIVLAGTTIAKNDERFQTMSLNELLSRYVEEINDVSSHGKELLDQIWQPYQKLMQALKKELLARKDRVRVQDCYDLLYYFSFLYHKNIPLAMFDSVLLSGVENPPKDTSAYSGTLSYEIGSPRDRANIPIPCLRAITSVPPEEGIKQRKSRIYAAISELADWSLITIADSKQLSLHPLIQACARESLQGKKDAYEKSAAFMLCQAIRIRPDMESRSFHRSLLPHLKARHNALIADEVKIFKTFGVSATAAQMVLRISLAYFESGYLDVACEKQRYTVQLLSRERQQDTGLLLKAKALLATSLHDFNGVGQRNEALKLRREIYEAAQKLAIKDIEYFDYLSDLADSLELLHNSRNQAVLYRQQVCDFWQELQPDGFKAIEASRRLAQSLFLAGDRTKALTLRSEICNKIDDDVASVSIQDLSNEFTLRRRRDLAQSWSEQGYWIRALTMRESILEGFVHTLGELHHDTIIARQDLANSYTLMHRFDEAIKLSETIFEHYCNTLGFDHPLTITSYVTLARRWKKIGHITKAKAIEEQALSVWANLPGEQISTHSKDILRCKAHLAQSLELLARYSLGKSTGKEKFKEALQLRQEIYHQQSSLEKDETNLDVLSAHNNIASCYSAYGENDRAISTRKAILTVFETHYQSFTDQKDLDFRRLQAYYEVKKNLARDYERVAKDFADMAGNENDGLFVSSEAQEASLSDDSGDDANSAASSETQNSDESDVRLGMQERRRYEKLAQEHFKEVYEYHKRVSSFELDHVLLISMIDLGKCLGKQNENGEEAISLIESSLETMRRDDRLGTNHPSVQDFQEDLDGLRKNSMVKSWVHSIETILAASPDEGTPGEIRSDEA